MVVTLTNPYQATANVPPPAAPPSVIQPPTFAGGAGLQSQSPWQALLGGYSSPAPTIRAPAFNGSAGLATPPPANGFTLTGPAANTYNATLGIYNARAQQNSANQFATDAAGRVVNAQMGLQPYYQQHLAAQGGVLDAQGRQQALERAYLQSTGQNIAASQAEGNAIWNASQNVPDLAAVASVNQQRDAEDARAREYGVTPDQRINVPMGQQGATLPSGIQATARPTFQYLSDEAQHNQHNREFALETAKNAVDMAGTDVNAAQLIASRAGLSLDQAQNLVTQAQTQEAAARVGSQQAGNNLASATLTRDMTQVPSLAGGAPGEVMYQNPATGVSQWASPAEAASLQLPAEIAHTQALYQGRQQARYSTGDLAGFADSYLGTLLVNGLADEQSVRSALAAKGYNSAKIDTAIARMRLQRPAKRTGALGVGDVLGGGSGATAGAAPADNAPATTAEEQILANALGMP